MSEKQHVEVVISCNPGGVHETRTIEYELQNDGWYIYDGDEKRLFASFGDQETIEQLIRKEFSELY